MSRFHVVVFNCERISLFLDNFDKIKNFDPEQDKLYIFDCSFNREQEQEKVANFLKKQGWEFNKQVHFIVRRNWGIDQGARIDYFSLLADNYFDCPPKYIWQFQEHYLDLTSPASRYPVEFPKIGGQIKADVSPDNLIVDLDECEKIYEADAAVAILYAARLKIILFSHKDGTEWFYANGGNYFIRASYALQVYDKNLLDSYKMIFDGKSAWTLFMEMDQGYRLTRKKVKWYDLVSGYSFDLPETLRNLETTNNVVLQQDKENNHEDYYNPLYDQYQQRCLKALNTQPLLRKILFYKALFVDSFKSKARKIKRSLFPQKPQKHTVLQDGKMNKI